MSTTEKAFRPKVWCGLLYTVDMYHGGAVFIAPP